MERNNKLQPAPVTEMHPDPAPTSPFNYGEVSEEESNRRMAMERANDKVKNDPSRSTL